MYVHIHINTCTVGMQYQLVYPLFEHALSREHAYIHVHACRRITVVVYMCTTCDLPAAEEAHCSVYVHVELLSREGEGASVNSYVNHSTNKGYLQPLHNAPCTQQYHSIVRHNYIIEEYIHIL